MNIKLSFTPVSQNPLDLLIVVLDADKTLHEVDDPAIARHLEKAAAGFREKTLKREYHVTLPEGSPAGVAGRRTGARASRAGTSGRT